MRRSLLALVVAGLVIAAFAAACGGGDGGNDENGGATPTAAATGVASPTATGPPFPFEGPVGIDLFTLGVFVRQGEPVRFIITVAASETVTLYYRTTQRYDIVVTDSEGTEVWRWSKDKAFGEVVEEVTLEENETLTFDESWDQRDNDGQLVPPGSYSVTATSTHCDSNLQDCGRLSASRALQIRAS